MLYFATASGPLVREAMDAGKLGQIVTPAAGNRLEAGRVWCGDNSVFGDKYPGDAEYHRWIQRFAEHRAACRFIVAPDVVCDAAATLERSAPHFAPVRALGFPVALVGQNGLEDLRAPWGEFDALFIGGDDAWKEGSAARELVAEARAHGKWVHMGRVNSRRRLAYAKSIGCHSADGTYLAFGPRTNLPKLLRWLDEINGAGMLSA